MVFGRFFKNRGSRVSVCEEDADDDGPECAPDGDRSLSVSPVEATRKLSAKNAPITQDKLTGAQAFTEIQMSTGVKCSVYISDDDGKTFKEKQGMTVFYQRDRGGHAALMFAANKENCTATLGIFISEISDVYVGKQMNAFQQPCAKNATDNRCVSLVSKARHLDIELKSPEVLTGWLSGVSELIKKVGRKTVYENQKESEIKDCPLSLDKTK